MKTKLLRIFGGCRVSFVCTAFALIAAALPSRVSAIINGADISWVPQMGATGRKWKDKNGVEGDVILILKDMGINAVRLRTWVNPSKSPQNGHCSQPETIALAVRCKKAGLRVMIDFHYGDSWNSVGSQNPPAAWVGQSYSQMRTTLYNYTYNFCVALKNAGVYPAYISPGNEENSGICHPTGSISNPAQMTGLIMEGYNAIKRVFPNCLVVIHVAQIQKAAAQAMLDAYQANGGKWDVTGFSSYASGINVPIIVDAMDGLRTRFGKPVMQVEFGAKFDHAGQAKTDLGDLISGMKGIVPYGLGVFWFEPENYTDWSGYNLNAWDPVTERPTVALDPYSSD